MTRRLYADNAATSFPKPPRMLEAMTAYTQQIGASAGRGAYREAGEAGELLGRCRRRLAKLIGATGASDNIIFTLNCTGALNLAIHGMLRPGDHVVTTTMEHNSVLRPLAELTSTNGIDVSTVEPDEDGIVPADEMIAAIQPETKLVAMIHASNVTGSIQPIAEVGRAARSRHIPFLVDAAQTAGHVPIDVEAASIDLLAVPGHKALMGPLGTGALFIRPGLEDKLRPLLQGGTGSVSDQPVQPELMPDRFESGSHNAVGLAGLDAALDWLDEETVTACRDHDMALSRTFLDGTRDTQGLTILGPNEPEDRVAVFSVRVDQLDPAELSAILEAEFDILTRAGLHCAPLAHRALGTDGSGGTTRLSFGHYTTLDDASRCAEALTRVAANSVSV